MIKNKKTEVKRNDILSSIPNKTPRWAVGIAVIGIALIPFYPMFSREIESYVQFKKLNSTMAHELRVQKLDSETKSKDASLQALAQIAIENAKALRDQAKQMGSLTEKVSNLEEALIKKDKELAECLSKLKKGKK